MKQRNLAGVSDGLRNLSKGLRALLAARLEEYYKHDWWERGVRPYLDPPILRRITRRTLDQIDAAGLLKVFLGNWRPVFGHMNALARTYAHEVLDVRNCVAHWSKDEDFPTDDAKRAIDTMRRLLKFVGTGPAADECGGLEERLYSGFDKRSHEERIIHSLSKDTPQCDDCLSKQTGITPRQAVNKRCRALEKERQVARREELCPGCGRYKIVNRIA